MQEFFGNSMEKVLILGTGGTISGVSVNNSDVFSYKTGQVSVENLLKKISKRFEISNLVVFKTIQVAQIDSKDIKFKIWHELAKEIFIQLSDPEVLGVVVTHGTDTIEETAYFLDAVLPLDLLAKKPVVLTGSMLPASALDSDGPENLLDSIIVLLTPGAKGVMVVFAGFVHGALNVQKIHPTRLNPFDSGEAGYLGLLESGKLKLIKEWSVDTSPSSRHGQAYNIHTNEWPWVEVVMNYAGSDGGIVRAMLSFQTCKLKGIIVAGTGNGTISSDLEQALFQAQKQGVKIARTSRCQQGFLKTSNMSAITGVCLSAVKARISMMLSIMGE